jgi:hypothetical protein
MKLHVLKTHQEPFMAIVDGKKKFEYRKNDRDFKIGNYILIQPINVNNNAS